MLKKTLFKIARSDLGGFFMGFAFEKLSFFIPVDRIMENKNVLVFYHPVKHWEQHILIVPKKAIRTFLDIDLNSDWGKDLVVSIFQAGINAAEEKRLDRYTIMVNGGKYQDVPQVHFHLASGKDKLGGALGDEKEQIPGDSKVVFESKFARIYLIDDEKIKKHFIVKPKNILTPIDKFDFENSYNRLLFVDILGSIQQFLRQIKLSAFTVLINHGDKNDMMFHIVSHE